MRLLRILEKYTDGDHPFSRQDIIDRIKTDYGIEVDRKTVARDLTVLRQAGYEIATGRNGVFLQTRRYEKSEVRFLIDSVLSSRNIDEKHSSDLVQKLLGEQSVYFSDKGHLPSGNDWDKSPNKSVFYTIEILDEAITQKRKVVFMYNGYDFTKKLIPIWKDTRLISPYFLIFLNQRYYLVGSEEGSGKVSYYRIDRITGIEPARAKVKRIEELAGGDAVRPEKLGTTFPYFLNGAPEAVRLRCHKAIFSDLVDWFGSGFSVEKNDGDYVEVVLNAPAKAMTYWALQYGESAEVIEPESLRLSIGAIVKKMSVKYNRRR